MSATILLLLPHAFAADLTLTHTAMEVDVAGPLADLVVTQTYTNPTDAWLEATYVFPLHEDGAVQGLVMRVGDRVITGEVMERQQARQAYDKAKGEGRAAALTDQERPNVFTQRVANLPPKGTIEVEIHVVQPVERDAGEWVLTLPLVVGPRFTTAAVEDASAITPPVARADTGHRVDVDVAIEVGAPLAGIRSPSHPELSILTDETGAAVMASALPSTRDFTLRWTVDADEPRAAALVDGDHLLLTFEGPESPARAEIVPRELIWVVDSSCSMQGAPMTMAKKAILAAFDGMDARDAFTVLDFNDSVSTLSARPVPATPANIATARAWVAGFTGNGGTDMLNGVRAALAYPGEPTRERYVAFLTDGYIGDEDAVFAAVEDGIGDARLHSFGIGGSVNRALLDGLADAGRGTVTYVGIDEDPAAAVERFLDTVGQPVLTDITVDWGDWKVESPYPARIPDLMAGQPLRVSAKVVRRGKSAVRVRGRLGGGTFDEAIAVVDVGPDGDALATTWARARIADLSKEQRWGEVPEVAAEILRTSLEYGIMSRYTSFVAVDRVVTNRTGAVAARDVAVNVPDGVSYEAAVSREYLPPGDPLLTVEAPEDARAVVAVFPWGERASLRWDPLRGRWFHRFLVPREVEDGPANIVILVVDAEGEVERREQLVHIDGEAPEIEALVEIEDGFTRVTIYPEEPLRSVQIAPVGAPELRTRRELGPDDDTHAVVIELPGLHEEVSIIAKDRAMNTLTATAHAGDAFAEEAE